MIHLEHISKSFKIPIRTAGLKSAIQSFFHREYRQVQALDDISFHINEGEIVGYIGPNGSGKSTTIKIMSGILLPDCGEVRINHINPFKQRIINASQIGVVFGQRTQLWWDLPVGDSFELIKDIYKIPELEFKQRLKHFISLFELELLVKQPVRQLSLGQRMRCDIVASLLHNPKVLFLDEPTIGLDANAKANVRHLIKKINQEFQTTIILTTHDMQDIQSLASRVILIGEGKLLYDGSLEYLLKHYGSSKQITLSFQGKLPHSLLYDVEILEAGFARIKTSDSLAEVLSFLQSHIHIEQLEVDNTTIDDVILNVYQDYHL